ncbi:MAG: hypothetical protein HY238_09935 [Acidobacteria bacterium]|nr:hypothetical protein [Acidobacteriota bacterium]
MRSVLFLVAIALAGCRSQSGPPAETVRKAGEALFERAAKGESVPGIQFTAQGTAIPKLISTEIRARRRVPSTDAYEYDVRLTYLNRIQQMEWASIPIRFERRGDRWEPL